MMNISDFRGAQLVLVFDGKKDEDLVRRVEAIFGSRDPAGDFGYGGTREDTGWRVRAVETKDLLSTEMLTTARHSLVAYITSAADGQPLVLPSLVSSDNLPDTNAASLVVRLNSMPRDAVTGEKLEPKSSSDVLDGAGDWEPAVKRDFIGLWLMAQAIRLVINDLLPEQQKLRLFISHAKLDGVPLAHAIFGQIELLGAMKYFYDVKDLDQTKDIEKQLRMAVSESVVIALRSDCYDERPWCRWEVERADEYGCPVLVVDARTRLTHPPSSLAYAAAPGVRIPDGNTLRILAETLRLSLRTAMARRKLADANAKPFFIPRTPSILSLVRACQEHQQNDPHKTAPLSIVYPDPPLETGAWEAAKRIVNTYSPGGRLSTVTEHLVYLDQTDPNRRPLAGLTVGLSISEPEDLKEIGFSKADIDRFIVRFAETLLGLGARLVFGHDWRHGGVMEAVSEAAIRFRPLNAGVENPWSITNFIPWPAKPDLEQWRRDQIKDIIKIEEAGLPGNAVEWSSFAQCAESEPLPEPPKPDETDSPEQRWWRASALSHLRARLNAECDARVCLGGKLKAKSKDAKNGHQGWFPGVVEEAFHAFRSGCPVFTGKLFGGVAQVLAEGWDANAVPSVAVVPELMELKDGIRPFTPNEWWAQRLPEKGEPVLSQGDRARLHATKDMEEFLLLVVKGLVAVQKNKGLG